MKVVRRVAVAIVTVTSISASGAMLRATATKAKLNATADAMPDIGNLLKGYDLMYGNPLPTGSLPLDPGFREPVFQASYAGGSLTPDQRYKQPDGTIITSCSGVCSLHFDATAIAGARSYSNSLEKKTTVSGGGWGAKFSASTDYKRVEEGTSQHKSFFTQAEASCCAYTAAIQTYEKPSLHPNFLAGLKSLPTTYESAKYNEFIATFGTHYLSKATMGAIFGQQSEVTSTAWTHMESTGLDIKAAASFSAFGASASASHETDSQKKQAEAFSASTASQQIYSVGAKPPGDNKASSWVQESIISPAPISFELVPIDELIDDSAIKSNLQRALSGYCNKLKSQGIVKSCNPPPPDKPFPQPASFPVHQLKTLLTTLTKIYPEKDNKQAWATIRGKSVGILAGVTQQNFPDMMRELLTCLESISGHVSQNVPEWNGVSKICGGLLEDAQPPAQFWSLVKALDGVRPTRCNKAEWTRIRSTCDGLKKDSRKWQLDAVAVAA